MEIKEHLDKVKMKKNFLIGIIGIGLLLAVVFGIYYIRQPGGQAVPTGANANLSKILSTDEIAKHPDRFKGSIEVIGIVTKVDEFETLFFLGCEDACVAVPVKYEGQMPDLGSEVIVSGEIKETEGGRYIIEGQKVNVQ